MKVVCIKHGPWVAICKAKVTDVVHPQKGEIYHVENMVCLKGRCYYLLTGFDSLYTAIAFLEVDNTFGHVVCQTIEQQIQLEKVTA